MSNLRNEMLHRDEMSKGAAYFILAIFFIFLIGGLYFFKEKYLSSNFLINQDKLIGVSDLVDKDSLKEVQSLDADSDGDGISNWREMIYGTNQNSSNSLDAGLSKDEDKVEISSSTNLTSILSRDLYVAAQYKNNNDAINSDSLVSAIDENYSTLLGSNEAYTLNTISEPSESDTRQYGNEMGSLFTWLTAMPYTTELSELSATSSDFRDTKNKIKVIDKVCDYSIKLKNIPLTMQSEHLDFINNCKHYSNILSGFVTNAEDPYKAVIAIKDHPTVLAKIAGNLKIYKNEFSKAKYKYKASEPGVYFNISN